jgi:Cys-rich protein (TIGR01571 family)
VAPATLQEGYEFDVTLGGKHGDRPFTVTVPRGGVIEGEEFEIPYPSSDDDEGEENGSSQHGSSGKVATMYGYDDASNKGPLPCRTTSRDSIAMRSSDEDDALTSDAVTGAPHGRWRRHMCSCCDVLTQSTFWMAFACTPVLVAQLVTRLNLTYRGESVLEKVSPSSQTAFGDAREETSLSFNKIVLSFAFVLFVANFLPGVGFVVIAGYTMAVLVLVGSNVRRSMRERYKIPQSLPLIVNDRVARFEDCLCMSFCGCCALIQMARHTHNDKEYPGFCCTTTGLEAGAPKIV